MRKPNRNYYGTQPNKPIYKTKLHPANPIQSVDSNTHNNNNGNISNSHEPIIHKKYWPPSLTDAIAFCMLVVTGFLAWFTFGLYQSATDDSKTSQISAQAANQSAITAQKTLNAIKAYNTKSLDKQQSSLDSGFKRDTTTFGLQNRSFKETQKEFDIENRPLVQVLNIRFDTLIIGKHLVIKFDFINYGKQPVKCLTNQMQVAFAEKNKNPIVPETNWVTTTLNSFMSGTATSQNSWTSTDTATKLDFNRIKKGEYKAYLIGTMIFYNTVTFKKSKYIYEYSVFYNNNAYGNEGIKDTTIQIPQIKNNPKSKRFKKFRTHGLTGI